MLPRRPDFFQLVYLRDPNRGMQICKMIAKPQLSDIVVPSSGISVHLLRRLGHAYQPFCVKPIHRFGTASHYRASVNAGNRLDRIEAEHSELVLIANWRPSIPRTE